MIPDYLTDRMPLIPLFLDAGDRILAVHTIVDGKPDEVEDVDLTVTGKTVKRKDGEPFGRSEVAITFTDAAGTDGERTFRDPEQWVSVERRWRDATEPVPFEMGTAA